MEAQRFPDDFDGWLVGAPGNNWTGHMTEYLKEWQVIHQQKEPLLKSQIEALSTAAIARCDASDGVVDGIIQEPLKCGFDPGQLLCKSAPDGRCLSAPQVATVRELYDDVRDAKTHASLAPGYQGVLGIEADIWPDLLGINSRSDGTSVISKYFSENFWRDIVYGDTHIDVTQLKASHDLLVVGTILDC